MPNQYIINGGRVSADIYNKEKYEDMRVRVRKGNKAAIRAAASAAGQSVNAYVIQAVEERMQREKTARG